MFFLFKINQISFAFTSVLIDKRLFKSCIRYSGDGGGGNDGLNRKKKNFNSKKLKFSIYLNGRICCGLIKRKRISNRLNENYLTENVDHVVA